MAQNIHQTTLATNMSKSNGRNDLEELRNWYQRRSQDFTSTNYMKYVDDKNMMARIEDGFMRFEKRLQMEKEKLHREFEKKLSLARNCALTPRSSILNDFLALNERIRQSSGLNGIVVTKSTVSPMQFLHPNDLCDSSSDTEEEFGEDDEDEVKIHDCPNEPNESPCQTEHLFSNNEKTLVKWAEVENNDSAKNVAPFPTTSFNNGSEFCCILQSTPIKPPQNDKTVSSGIAISPTLENGKTPNQFENSLFFKWLNYFVIFEDKLRREIGIFKEDKTKKEFRTELSRTIATRINDGAKKNVSSHNMGLLFNFFDDLLACRSVDGWREGAKLSLTHGDKSQQLFAMETICTRYLEMVKWDSDLMEHSLLILVKLCKKSNNFYKIFCTKIANFVVLLSMDQDKVIAKIVGFGNDQPQEAIVQWINNESVVFRLFCRVQFALKSFRDEETPEKTQGFALLKEMFSSVADCQRPVILSSPFILFELLQFAKLFNSKNDDELAGVLSAHFMPSIKRTLIGREWDEFVTDEQMQILDACTKGALAARHAYLLDHLQDSLEKFEH